MLNKSLQDNARRAPTFLVFSLSVVACLWLGGQRAAGNESAALYDTAPLSSPVEQLRAWADKQETLQPKPSIRAAKDAVERKTSLVRLLNEQRFYFATDGTVRTMSWEIFRVKDKEGASSASRVDAMWEPWHKDRPTIEARVINPDGSVITNDGKDAIEQPAGNSDPSVMTDSRQLTLLLHGVELNSIVEIKISSVERMEAGAWFNRASMTDFYPAKVHRLVIEHDKDVKLISRCVGPELTPQTTEHSVGGAAVKDAQPYRQIVYHVDLPQPAMDQMETGCGPDRSSLSTIEFGTPRAWTELGKHYAQSVEKAIGEGNKFSVSLVKSVAAQSKAWTAREKVVWCDQEIRKALRYTSLAFGEQRIYPVSPDTVFARRFGDCKDHATLLVAMLREMGVTSHVALVYTAGALDVPQDAGAFGLFNHAITYVPEIDQWVDLTAEDFPVGMLPLRTQGRRALICDTEAGRIMRTPMISAAQNQSNEVRSYDLNFSGGGHITIGLACKGNYGLDLRNGYEDAPADQLIESWNDYFKEDYGIAEVRSLQRCAYAPGSYAIRCASSAAQLIDRDTFEYSTSIDARDLLGKLPTALHPQGYEADGKPITISHRAHPLVITNGLRATVTYAMLFPAGLTLTFDAKNWKEKFGAIELSATYAESDISSQVGVERDAHLKWEEVVPKSTAPAYKWTSACDRELRVKYEIMIEPGELAVDEVNRCIDFLNQLHGPESRFARTLTWKWTVLEKFLEKPNSELFKELARQAKLYHAFVDPRLALAVELRRFRLDRIAQSMTGDIAQVGPEYSLGRSWLTALRSTDVNGVQFSPLIDHHALRELNRNLAPIQGSPVRFVDLHCALSDKNGLHTLDKDSLEYAQSVFEAFAKDGSFGAVSKEEAGMLQNDRNYVLLALHKDEELKQLLRQSPVERFNPTEAMILGKELKVPKNITVKQRDELKRVFWEAMMNCGRPDLAHRLHREYWPEPKLLLATADDQQPKLAPLDRTDAQSVAQHAVLAMLTYQPAVVEEMLADKEAMKYLFAPPTYSPIALDEWFIRQRSGRSLALIEAVIKLTPIETKDVGKTGKIVTFKNPHQKRPFVLWLVQESDGKWTLSPAIAEYFAQRLIKYCEDGDREQAGRWLEVIMPPLVRELPWFDNVGGSAAARAWSLKEDSRRIELTVALLRANRGSIQPLEKWLAKNTEPLPPNIQKIIEQELAKHNAMAGKFGQVFELELKRTEETKDVSAARGTILAAVRMQRHSHEPFDLARVQAVVEKAVAAKSTDPAWKMIEFHLALLAKDDKRAFGMLEKMLEAKKVETEALNAFLWSSLVTQVSSETLKERLAKATSLGSEAVMQDRFYLHTLACTQAVCGDPYSAAEKLAELAGNWPDASEELLRGLILEQLDMPQEAKSSFEQCIELEPYSDSAVIAKHHLEMNR